MTAGSDAAQQISAGIAYLHRYNEDVTEQPEETNVANLAKRMQVSVVDAMQTAADSL